MQRFEATSSILCQTYVWLVVSVHPNHFFDRLARCRYACLFESQIENVSANTLLKEVPGAFRKACDAKLSVCPLTYRGKSAADVIAFEKERVIQIECDARRPHASLPFQAS